MGSTFSEPVVVYDSLGNSHTITFTKAASNTWSYNIAIPAADVGQTGSPVSVGTGTLQSDASGNLTSPSANVTGINVTGLTDGAKNLSLTWQLFSPTTNSPNITQVAGQSNVSSAMQGGHWQLSKTRKGCSSTNPTRSSQHSLPGIPSVWVDLILTTRYDCRSVARSLECRHDHHAVGPDRVGT